MTGFNGKASFSEDIIVNPQNHTFVSKSENISYKGYTSSSETCEYIPSDDGQSYFLNLFLWNRTVFQQQMNFDLFVPFKEKIESYSIGNIVANAKKGIDVMESICLSLGDNLKNATCF